MSIGTKSTSTGIPNLGFGEEETLFSTKKFMVLETAQLWDNPGPSLLASLARQLCSAVGWMPLLFLLVCFELHWSALLCSAHHSLHPLSGKEKCTIRVREELRGARLYEQKYPPLVPDWSVLMQMRALSCLVGIRATLVGQSCAALIRWGKPQYYWLK